MAAKRPGGVRAAVRGACSNHLRDVPGTGQNVRLVDPDDFKAQRIQIGVAIGVMPLAAGRFVGIPVHLDDQLRIKTSKVYDVRTDWRLAAKLEAFSLQVPKFIPEE